MRQTVEKGYDPWMADDDSVLIPRNTAMGQEINRVIKRILDKHEWKGTVPLHPDGGTYNFYLNVAHSKAGVEIMAMDQPARASKDKQPFPRQARRRPNWGVLTMHARSMSAAYSKRL